MCPPGDTSRGRRAHRTDSRQELQQEPIAQNDPGWDRDKKNQNESKYASARVKNDIGSHDPGDGAAGSESGGRRMEVEGDVEESGANPTNEIEKKIRQMAEVVFDIVSKDPEEEHVPRDVQKTRMEEHARKDRKKGGLKSSVAVKECGNARGDGGIR